MAIARNALLDEVRRGRRLMPLPETLASDPADREEAADVRRAMNTLPERQQRLLRLVYVEGFSHREVAIMSDTTEGAIKTAAWRAREAFRVAYEQGGSDG